MGVCEDCRVMDGSSCEGCFKLKEENERLSRAFTAGFEAAKKKAMEIIDYDGSAACAYCERINELISNMKEE